MSDLSIIFLLIICAQALLIIVLLRTPPHKPTQRQTFLVDMDED
jgi:hypothetical protein